MVKLSSVLACYAVVMRVKRVVAASFVLLVVYIVFWRVVPPFVLFTGLGMIMFSAFGIGVRVMWTPCDGAIGEKWRVLARRSFRRYPKLSSDCVFDISWSILSFHVDAIGSVCVIFSIMA